MNVLGKNYQKGYEMILEEYKDKRRKNGLSNVGYPNKIMWIYLSFLAIGASMALTVTEKEGHEDPHISRAVWITLAWLIMMAVLFFAGIIR